MLDQSKLKVLPEPTRAYGAVARATEGAMAERGYTAVDLCHQLKLSKPYFSVWRNEGVKGVLSYNMPKATRALYTSAVERWLANEDFEVERADLTGTKSTQVPRTGAKRAARPAKATPTPKAKGKAPAAASAGGSRASVGSSSAAGVIRGGRSPKYAEAAARMPAKGSRKRVAWDLAEAAELQFHVGQLGEGKWAAIKQAGAKNGMFMERTPADLRDKWRNLQKAEEDLEEAN